MRRNPFAQIGLDPSPDSATVDLTNYGVDAWSPPAAAADVLPDLSALTSPGPSALIGTLGAGTSAAGLIIPPGSDSEIAFLSGVTSSGAVAETSFATWHYDNPASYNTQSKAFKWGANGNTLGPYASPIGSSGGTVTYWFDTTANWTTAEKNELLSGLAIWSAEVNISFAEAGSFDAANFVFKRISQTNAYFSSRKYDTPLGASYLYNPDNPIDPYHPGIKTKINISIDTSVYSWELGTPFTTAGGYGWETVVHEEGHLIGLGHGGPYNGSVDPTSQQFSAYDTRLWTLMSYIDPWNSAKYSGDYPVTDTSWGIASDHYHYRPTTPMILDILAAQRLYGSSTSGPLSTGGQVFGFNSNIGGLVGQFFDFTINTHPVITLWDAGANNTLDVSGWSTDSLVNMAPGTFSCVNGMTNNIGIAMGTIIDNAVTGAGNDTVYGGATDDHIYAGAGNDSIYGGAGNDWLSPGDGVDFVDGGAGLDIYSVNPTTSNIAADLTAGRVTLNGGTETFVNIEGFDAGSGNDTLSGSPAENVLYGGAGNDSLLGLGGSDSLYGGAGNDWLLPGAGVDFADGGNGFDTYSAYLATGNITADLTAGVMTLNGVTETFVNIEAFEAGSGNDSLTGSSADNALYGGAGNDSLLGLGGSDSLYGGEGNDWLLPGAGVDFADGGNGFDTYSAYLATGNITADLTAGVMTLNGVTETFVNIEAFEAGSGNDSLTGSAADNALYGGAGNDSLLGLGGSDSLYGGDGNDWLLPGAGIDFADGGAGFDTYSTYLATANITADLTAGVMTLNGVTETFVNVEAFEAGSGNDSLTGSAVANALYGGAGNDVITGLAGNDTLYGGKGSDLLTGGDGADTFVFTSDAGDLAAGLIDTITDFITGTDKIDLTAISAQFGALTLSGALQAGTRGVFFDAGSKYLSIDWNGDGVADMKILLQAATKVVASDLVM